MAANEAGATANDADLLLMANLVMSFINSKGWSRPAQYAVLNLCLAALNNGSMVQQALPPQPPQGPTQ